MILVLGGAGYIGSHMAERLLEKGFEVVVLDDLSTGHRALVPGCTFVEGGLGDEGLLRTLFGEHRFSAVMHFAAFSQVGESVRDPLKYWRNNVGATEVLIRVMLERGVKRFIFSSSAAVYGEPDRTPIREDAPLAPTSPYGATKVAVERMLADCEAAHGLRYVSLRYFNAAGADLQGRRGERHDPETHLVPLVLKAISGKRESITVFGDDYPTPDGTCVRDYIHVLDLVEAHLLSLEHLQGGGGSRVFNLGNGQGYSVMEVIRTAEEVTGRRAPVVMGERRAGDPAVLVADAERIHGELGWEPGHPDLAEILRTAWKWEELSAGWGRDGMA